MAANERKEPGHLFGIHRVLDVPIQLPQACDRLDNTLPIYSNEILIEVERLNIDAASFVQMEIETKGNPDKIAYIVLENTLKKGKQQNAETGSGGMLIGKVAQIGSHYKGPLKAKVGDKVATLVSLTLTPLFIRRIKKVDLKTHQIEIEGHAILFESAIAAVLPADLEEKVAMAVFDVAGAPATVHGHCKPGQTVVVIGAGGKAGILSCVAARQKIGAKGKLIAVEPFEMAAQDLEGLKVCDAILRVDATDPIAVFSSVQEATHGKMGDVVINVASVRNTETGSILSAKKKANVIFFSMATSFTKVALGAEGVAASANLIFGNGYYPNHAKYALELLKKHKKLKELFYKRYIK